MYYDKHGAPLVIGDFVKSPNGGIYEITESNSNKDVIARSVRYGWKFYIKCSAAEKADPKEVMFEILQRSSSYAR